MGILKYVNLNPEETVKFVRTTPKESETLFRNELIKIFGVDLAGLFNIKINEYSNKVFIGFKDTHFYVSEKENFDSFIGTVDKIVNKISGEYDDIITRWKER